MALQLFMILAGCKPAGRHTEQHDVFFCIAPSLSAIVPKLVQFWPEAGDTLHVDGWRAVTAVDGYMISVAERTDAAEASDARLFFVNLGGYKRDEFEEYHYKLLSVGAHKGDAIKKAKATAFYKHTGFASAASHVDDKYGIDVDDVYAIEDILSPADKERYTLVLTPAIGLPEDDVHLGYFMLEKL